MKIVVAVCVYNRFQNVKRWISCWQQSNTKNAELVIVHNYYGEQDLKTKFQNYCDSYDIKYIPRNGSGFDIGAMQDVFKERLPGFPDYDYLLWITDDVLPMSKDFITPFIKTIQQPNVGISCMQLSTSVSPHVRTSGFCISKELASRIVFPVDPIVTKQHCYLFEHRGGDKTFTNQIRKMGLSCEQVAPINISPLWDSDHPNLNKRLDRQKEFNRVWGIEPKEDKVVFICPVYNMYPQIISSLICQTYKNWELLLIHNGPLNGMKYDIPDDSRIKFIIYPEATGKWGHELRKWALQEIKEERLSQDANYIVITNADNYHMPAFTKSLLSGFKSSTVVASYCENMVHNYTGWGVIPCRFERGHLDSAGVMVKKDVACEIGWRDTNSHSSDWTYFEDIANRYNRKNFVKVPGCLLVHNAILFFILNTLLLN